MDEVDAFFLGKGPVPIVPEVTKRRHWTEETSMFVCILRMKKLPWDKISLALAEEYPEFVVRSNNALWSRYNMYTSPSNPQFSIEGVDSSIKQLALDKSRKYV